jgi:hypothetical protein
VRRLSTVVNPEARLRGYNLALDIATFDFSYEELMRMGKQAIPGSPWPPPEPIPELAVWFGGFPGVRVFAWVIFD